MKLKLAILGLSIITLMMLSTGVYGQFALTEKTSVFCNSNATLQIQTNSTRCIDDVCKDFTDTKEEFCAYGCDNVTLACSPNPFELNLWFIGIFVGFIFLLLFLINRTR